MGNISVIQIVLLSIILKVKFSYEITFTPTTVNLTEGQSVNIMCKLETTNGQVATIYIEGEEIGSMALDKCTGEGPIVTNHSMYGYDCQNNDTVVVTLKSVQRTSHLKTLVCKTNVNGIMTSSNNVTIYVKVPITDVTLNHASTVLKTQETKEIVIVCETSAGYPTPTIHWYMNESSLLPSQSNVDITDTSTDSYPMIKMSILRIYPGRGDNSSSLYCEANNSEDRMFYSDNVTMLIYYGPDKPTLFSDTYAINDTVDVVSGHSLKIQCKSISYPTPQYSWLTPDNSVVEGFILDIPNVTYPSSQGTYTCHVNVSMELSTGTEYRKNETSVFVNVPYPTSIVKFEVNGQPTINVTVNETDQLIFVCTVDSKPASNVSIWYKGTIIKQQVVTTSISHTVTKVSCLQNGLYTCIAHNEYVTESPMKVLTVSVLCSPRPKSNKYLQKFFTGKLYKRMTISFEVLANPAPNTDGFVWKRKTQNGSTWAKLEINDMVEITTAIFQSNLTFKNITRSYFGIYKLEVTNTIDTYTHQFVLKEEAVASSSEASFQGPMIAGIGCSVVVLCLVVLAIVLYKLRIRKKERRENFGDTRPGVSRSSQENSQCETVFQHKNIATNGTEDTSKIVQDVSTAEPSIYSVSGRLARSTILVHQRNPSNEVLSGFSTINIQQKPISIHKTRDECDHKDQESTPENLLALNQDGIQSEPHNMDFVNDNVDMRGERVQLEELFIYVTSKLYEPEFQYFTKGLQYPTTIAEKTENIKLNRYRGIYPYDHSRVTIRDDPNFFMNACYINGYKKEKAYIASSGPTSNSTYGYRTFWKMTWHEQSDVIIMLTNLREVSGMKCQQYWPDIGTSKTYGDVTVTCQTIRAFAEYTVRTFDISKAGIVRPLTQLHFTAWPDQSVPNDVTSLLEFRQRIKATFSVKAGPIIVHCSAGIGRTGTMIALDMLIDEGKTEGSVNASACVKRLREQRLNMVQTQEQYAYIHKALVYALVFECEVIYTETFQEYLESTTDTFFENMFEKLRQNVSCNDEDKNRRINEQYKKINRPGADIPGDKQSIKLYLNKTSDDVDYINAVFVNSFKKKNHFISAQTPRTSSVEDFLSLIYQEDCLCIVTLDKSETFGTVRRNKDVGVYLPPDNSDLIIGNFKVSCERLETNAQYIVRCLKVENHGMFHGGKKISYHFQYIQWDSDKCVPNDASEFVQFVRIVDQYGEELGHSDIHTLVHCLDASERSGLFCCIASMIERIECEGQVNVGNTIRQIRSRRMSVIQNMEQLRFCYQAVNAYISMKKTQ